MPQLTRPGPLDAPAAEDRPGLAGRLHRVGRRLDRATRLCLAGLLVGIVGLLVQWAADPGKFGGAQKTFGMPFPPGILFVAGFGLLTVATSRWWWHPVLAAFIAFWIVGVGTLAGQLTPNLTSHNAGTVTGNVIMAAGLAVSVVTGIAGTVTARRRSRTGGR